MIDNHEKTQQRSEPNSGLLDSSSLALGSHNIFNVFASLDSETTFFVVDVVCLKSNENFKLRCFDIEMLNHLETHKGAVNKYTQ